MGLSAVPADPMTVGRYLVKLSTRCKYVTINNYLSAMCVLHKFYGYQDEFRSCFLVKMILSGIKAKYGAEVNLNSDRCIPYYHRGILMRHAGLD